MTRFLTMEEEIFLNQFSQGIHTIDDMRQWFDSFDILNKRDIIENLLNMVIQSHPTIEEIESSAVTIGKLKSSSATILLNKNKPFNKFGYKICHLPEKELTTGFCILLLTLSKADNRRKCAEMPNECNHWWHKDLSDPIYIEELIKGNTGNTGDGSVCPMR